MEATEHFKTFPLIDADMFKKQLKNYYVLFSQQQTTAKQPKKKKKDVPVDEEIVVAKSKSKKSATISDDSKLHQFKVSFHNTVNGVIEFNHNSKELSLEFTVNNPKTKQMYKEIIYLPVLFDVKEILTIVRDIKNYIFLEYSKGKIIDEDYSRDFDYLELDKLESELILIIQELNKNRIDNINAELEAENELLIKYRILGNQLQTHLQNSRQSQLYSHTPEYRNAMLEYLMINQTLNHVNDENGHIIVYPGTRVMLNQKHGIITEIDQAVGIYRIKFDDVSDVVEVPIPKKSTGLENDLLILGSVRNNISISKNQNLDHSINLSDLFKKIENKRTLIDVLAILDIDLSISEITNRPRLEIYSNIQATMPKKIIVIDKINTFITDIDLNKIFDKKSHIIIGKNVKDTPDNMNIILPNWRQLFSMHDTTISYIIDDFEFKSIKHYHIASQFYNREDLSVNLKMEYNDFFIKFTNNFTGLSSLSKIDTHLLYLYIDNYSFKKPIIWSLNVVNGDNLESIYLKKAYYNKFSQNIELRQALINTYPRIIYERIGKNKLLINYELMLVRYYLYNNITPYFSKFNYNASIFKEFKDRFSETKEYEQTLLLTVFQKHNAYENRENLFINSDILYSEYNRLDISGNTNFEILSKYFHELLFSYNSVFVYELTLGYILNDTITHKSIDAFIKKYDLFLDESKWIFEFYYKYILFVLSKKQQVIEEDLDKEKQLNEKYRALQTILRANNYLIVDTALRSTKSFFDSIIEFLNRNKFKPFDVSSNKYSYCTPSTFKNKLFNKKEFTIYNDANDYLYSLLNHLYNLNQTTDKSFDETDYLEKLEILSRLLSIDILIINEAGIHNIEMKDIMIKYPNGLDKITTYNKARGRLVLGNIIDTDYFFSTKPYFESQERINIKYLIATNSKYVIQEETSDDGEPIHNIIGKWDPDNLVLDTQDTEPGDKLNGQIEIEDFMLYRLGNNIYYKDRELYL
jgi:hypothetical protein